MTGKDRYFIAELEERLRWYRDEASEEEFDAEEVDAICTLLQKLSPVKEPHMGREEAFRNIMRRIAEEEEGDGEEENVKEEDVKEDSIGLGITGTLKKNGADGDADRKGEARKGGSRKKKFAFEKRGYRAAMLFIAVFGGALISLNMVTYAREDKSLFTMIMERVGVLKIVKEETGEDSLISGEEEVGVFYNSWVEMDGGLKRRVIVPGYIPEDYALYGIRHYCYNNREKLLINYYDEGNGHLLIEITLWEDEKRAYKESAMDENVYTLLTELSDKNTLYYQYDDEYICMVSMKNSFYRISGNIMLGEMIKVREGLGDVK